MADIKQAAIWMKEGKHVRRKSWEEDDQIHMSARSGLIRSHYGGRADLEPADLLAEDWELAD